MSAPKPTLAEVRDLVATMVERSTLGWIGEGDEIATELLDYIDGKSPEAPTHWNEGMDKWAHVVVPDDPDETRGPFTTRREAEDWLSKIPEHGAASSPWGRTAPRDRYVVMTRDEFKRWERT